MNDPLRNMFKLQIENLTGFNFQGFITELFLLKYGANGFTVPREVRDKGCDGIIVSEKKVIACYGPERQHLNKVIDKIEGDFESYREYWAAMYPNWAFITNHDVSPELIETITRLKQDAQILGLRNIIALIEELDTYKRRKLGEYLKIDKEYFAQDYIGEILEDLLKDDGSEDKQVEYTKPPYVPGKIELNYEVQDIESATEAFDEASQYFPRIGDIIQGYRDKEISRIKTRVIDDFNKQQGSFKERFQQQTDRYLEKYLPGDDDYLTFIQAILLYHFEQCLIGEKTESEK